MNVFHHVLTKIFELSGGKETVDIDLIELTKREGFYSNIDNISKHLQDEGWITEAKVRHTVRITHWGVGEAKRVLSASPDKTNELEKGASRFLAECREYLVMVEEFNAVPDKEKLKRIEAKMKQLADKARDLSSYL